MLDVTYSILQTEPNNILSYSVPTDVHVFKGLPHGFRMIGNRLSASTEWDKVLLGGIRWALSRPTGAVELVIKEH